MQALPQQAVYYARDVSYAPDEKTFPGKLCIGYYADMNTVETIQSKLIHLPPEAQEEALGAIERIEARYRSVHRRAGNGDMDQSKDLLELLSEIKIEGPADLSERHDHYAHGKLEE